MIQHDFIYGNIINHDICDRLIDLFEETSDGDTPISLTNGWEGNMIKERGVVGRMKKEVSDGESLSTIDETRKMSTDLSVPHYADHPTVSQYNQELSKIIDQYCTIFPWVSSGCQEWGNAPWDAFNIQKYKPNEAFFTWHSERTTLCKGVICRYLVFMTYLNDVEDGGETEWFHQKLKIKPQKGLTVLWPPDWTYTHRGVASPTETKYIATGWFNFLPPEDAIVEKPSEIKDKDGVYLTSNRDVFLPF